MVVGLSKGPLLQTKSIMAAACTFYAAGIFQGLTAANGMANLAHMPIYQEQSGLTIGQRMLILVKYMTDHPEQLNQPTIGIAASALQQAYSSQQNSQKALGQP